ncbi:MAG: hypothetical protein KC563_15005 [Nitrospira sp.]|nr:hypothetical protein [Nitrospira sp.]
MIIQEDSHSISLGRSTGFQDTEGLSGTEQISLGPSKQDGILGPASVHSCENSDTQRIRCEKIFRGFNQQVARIRDRGNLFLKTEFNPSILLSSSDESLS